MKQLVLSLLGGYKRWISPALPVSCRFLPTCSEYAQEAVERHGVLCGTGLALWRLLRCHPLAKGGYDPVPDLAADQALTQLNQAANMPPQQK